MAVSAIIIALSSCSKAPEQSKYIPKTASVVLSVNSKEISRKLITNGITMDKLFAAVQEKEATSEAQKFWKDIENSGLDLQSNSFLSVVYDKNQSFVSLTGGLKDATKFEEYLKSHVSNYTLQTKSDFKYIVESSQDAVIAWNKGTVIYLKGIAGDAIKSLSPAGRPVPGDDEEATDSNTALPASVVVADDDMQIWVNEVDHLFHLKKEETAGSIEAFNDVLKHNADLSVYVNPEPIYSAQSAMMPANLKALLAGCYYTGTVNFENGKVKVDGVSYVGKELADIYKKYGNMEADLSMLEKYPSQNITGFLVYGFDFRMIGDIVKSTGLDGIANMGLRSSGLTLDDILNAFKGQLIFVSSDFEVIKKPSLYMVGDSTTSPTTKWVFAMKVGDKAAFDNVMSSPMLKGFFTKKDDAYVLTQNYPGMPAVSITDKMVTSASDEALLNEYLGGKGKAGGLDESFVGKIKGKPMGAYVNFEKIVNNIPDEEIPTDSRALAIKFKNLLKDMTAVNNNFDGKTQHSEIVLNFKNETENSLVQLVNISTEALKYIEQQKTRKAGDAANADSADAIDEDTILAEDGKKSH